MNQPSIDIILPMSDPWLVPYFVNTCNSLLDQYYPRELYSIILSYYYKEKIGDIADLMRFCADRNIFMLFNKWTDPVWNIGKAYNIAARHGSREIIACFDADVVFHPKTLKYAVRHLNQGISTVVPVARSPYGPEAGALWTRSDKKWQEITENIHDQRVGVGNILVPRKVFEHLHGFDERMHGWGSIDEDLYYRIMKHSSVIYLLDHGCPKAIHQKHPNTATKNTKYTTRNRNLMLGAKNPVRNPEGWGGIKV